MASAQEHGKLYVVLQSANGKDSVVPIDADSHAIGHVAPASATDRRLFYPLVYGQGGKGLEESGKLIVKFKSTAADIIESEESTCWLDVTLINKVTGQKQPVTLTFDDMTGFTSAGTVDLTFVAGQTSDVAYYTVPAGNRLVVGHPTGLGKAYIYIGDDS